MNIKTPSISKNHLGATALLIVAVAIVVLLVSWAQSPTSGKVLSTPVAATQKPEGYSTKQFSSEHLTFSYSGVYVSTTEAPKDNFVELHMLRAAVQHEKQIAVSVAYLPDGSLDSNGPYLHRKKRPDLYSSRQIEVSGKRIDVWVKHDGTEQTAIIPHNDKVVTLAFTSSTQDEKLGMEVDQLLGSMQLINQNDGR